MLTHALRGYGPRVFISYSFADTKLAQQVESALTAKGLQARREDDTSLFNEKLTAAIPRRMADAEVFIQIPPPRRTAQSGLRKNSTGCSNTATRAPA